MANIEEIYSYCFDKKIDKLTYRNSFKKFKNGKFYMNYIFVECECGNSRYMPPRRALSIGDCGCRQPERLAKRSESRRTHGKAGSNIYQIHRSMVNRCHNLKSRAYSGYGARGIYVCQRWLNFTNFYNDMGDPPTGKHSLDRIDNDGPYSKENCRWATAKDQANNRRSNRLLLIMGERLTLSEASEKYKIPYATLSSRINRGWNHDSAIERPVEKRSKRIGEITVDGLTMSIVDAARKYKINFKTISKRIKRGWTHEEAVKTPNGTRLKSKWRSND